MKKIIALALSLMLLLGCVSAPAETAEEKDTITMLGAFSIKHNKLPEGYSMYVLRNDDMEYQATISSADPEKPTYMLTIAFNDEWEGIDTLAQATEADIAAMKDSFYKVLEMDEGEITFEEGQTGLGTPVLIAKGPNGSFGAVYTIYMSHEIEVDIYYTAEDKAVTDDNINTVLTFLTDVEFTPVEIEKE